MKRFSSVSLLLSAIVLGCMSAPCIAQTNNNQPIRSAKSSGLTASISKINVSSRSITIQFVTTNNTDARIYFVVVNSDELYAITESGERLTNTSIETAKRCNAPTSQCAAGNKDLNDMSYIEPHEYMIFSVTYHLSNPISDKEYISFVLNLVARYCSPNADTSIASQPRAIRFNFPNTPLTK